MYFLRVDYIYLGSPVQRVRRLVPSLVAAMRELSQYRGTDYLVLQVKLEKCV